MQEKNNGDGKIKKRIQNIVGDGVCLIQKPCGRENVKRKTNHRKTWITDKLNELG